jgi:Undecaprenyl-phosphate galactose phosphotransferase WbaP
MNTKIYLRSRPVSIRSAMLLEHGNRLMLPGSRIVKRLLDYTLLIVTLPITVPIMLTLAAIVKLSSKGPVFFRQARLGDQGKVFYAYKFRTMRPDAVQALAKYLREHPELRRQWEEDHKLKDDPRITTFGQFLRKVSLDELPQLLNVLKGEMSLVGPRPIVEAEVERYGETYKLYTSVLPGITGLWQVSGRNDISYDERVRFDEFYVQNWSLWLDLHILLRTIRVIIFREGAY